MGIKKSPRYLEEIKIPTIKYCRILKYPLPLQRELKRCPQAAGKRTRNETKTLRIIQNIKK